MFEWIRCISDWVFVLQHACNHSENAILNLPENILFVEENRELNYGFWSDEWCATSDILEQINTIILYWIFWHFSLNNVDMKQFTSLRQRYRSIIIHYSSRIFTTAETCRYLLWVFQFTVYEYRMHTTHDDSTWHSQFWYEFLFPS